MILHRLITDYYGHVTYANFEYYGYANNGSVLDQSIIYTNVNSQLVPVASDPNTNNLYDMYYVGYQINTAPPLYSPPSSPQCSLPLQRGATICQPA